MLMTLIPFRTIRTFLTTFFIIISPIITFFNISQISHVDRRWSRWWRQETYARNSTRNGILVNCVDWRVLTQKKGTNNISDVIQFRWNLNLNRPCLFSRVPFREATVPDFALQLAMIILFSHIPMQDYRNIIILFWHLRVVILSMSRRPISGRGSNSNCSNKATKNLLSRKTSSIRLFL